MGLCKNITCILFFSCSIAFAGEIIQGTLTNGMRYYLCPESFSSDVFENNISIALVIKKPKHLAFLPLGDFFLPKAPFHAMYSESTFSAFLFSGSLECGNLRNGLSYFSHRLHLQLLPSEVINEIQEEYKEDKDDYTEKDCRLLSLIYGCNWEEISFLAGKDSEQISEAYRSLAEPSRMALVIAGFFNPAGLEQELENLFGDFAGNEILAAPFEFIPKTSLVIELTGLPEETDDEALDPEKILKYLYYYKVNPTFRNHVLNDLLYSLTNIQKSCCSSSIGRLNPIASFFSAEFIVSPKIDNVSFSKIKKQLEETYRTEESDSVHICTNHFLSGINDELKPGHENLLRELETVTLDEFISFVNEHISNAAPVQL